MKKAPTNFDPGKPRMTPQGPIRKSVLILTAIIGLGAVALVVLASRYGKDRSPGQAEQFPESFETGGVASEQRSTNSVTVRVRSRVARHPEETPPTLQPKPPVDVRQLVKSLSEVNVQPGELTPEKAAQWKSGILELVNEGRAAVPPLEEFFQRNADVRFDSGSGTNLLGEPTLRIAFMKVLFDIPTPDNVDLQERLLRTTTDPDEIALLARQLQAQEPGKHRELIIETARAALERARSGPASARGTKALAEIMEYHGAAP